MDVIGVSTENLIKKWKETKTNVLNLQRKKAEEFPCEIECRALEMHDSKYFRIPTPLKTFNDINNGGFQSATLTELVGPPGSGKSQFCLSLIANYLATESDKNIIYLDTNKNFSFDRLFQLWHIEMQNNISETVAKRLSRLYLLEPLSTDEFIDIFKDIDKYVESLKPSILIVDSMAYYIRGMPNVIKRLNVATNIIAVIKKLSVKHNVMVIVTNQISGYNTHGNQSCALGSSWLHYLNLRIYVDYTCVRGNDCEESIIRKIRVLKSPSLISFDIPFRILNGGVREI